MTKLHRLLLLDHGWDGRRAPPPTREAVQAARHVLQHTDRGGLGEVRVVADVEGGIGVYFFGGGKQDDGGWGRRGAILISNDGEATRYRKDRSWSEAEIEDISMDHDSLSSAGDTIRKFVLGI